MNLINSNYKIYSKVIKKIKLKKLLNENLRKYNIMRIPQRNYFMFKKIYEIDCKNVNCSVKLEDFLKIYFNNIISKSKKKFLLFILFVYNIKNYMKYYK